MRLYTNKVHEVISMAINNLRSARMWEAEALGAEELNNHNYYDFNPRSLAGATNFTKYINAVDNKAVAKADYNPFKEVGEVSPRFMWAIGKTIR